jgi:hypothetical protein
VSPQGRRVRDRDVLLLLGLVVGLALAVEVASAAIPGARDLLAGMPIVVAGLAVATVVVLLRAFRPR